MKTNALLATTLSIFTCMLGCDTDEGPSDAVIESVEAETPITEVDAAYVQANADANGLVTLDVGDDVEAAYRVQAEVLDNVVLASEGNSVAAREWLELSDTEHAGAESIMFVSPNATTSDEGFRLIWVCVCVGGVCVCVEVF